MASRRKPTNDKQLGLDTLWGSPPAVPDAMPPAPPPNSVPSVGTPLSQAALDDAIRALLRSPEPEPGPLATVIQLPRTQPAPARPTLDVDDPFPAYRPPEPAEVIELEQPQDELPLPEGLRLERNLALLAGAGAGKTYSLVTMCLHLLGGARRDHQPLPAAQLGLLTFTDKAAGEMRGRLRERLNALAEGRDHELELRASFAALDRPFPSLGTWRALRDELGAATIGTFHSLCTQLLRRAPPLSGVNPNFELLDERDARRLVREVVERVLLARVQAGHREVRHLVAEFGFAGLVGSLVPVFMRIREEGQSPQFVQVSDPHALRRQFDSALLELRTETARAVATVATKHHARIEQFASLLRATTFETVPEQVPRLRTELHNLRSEPFTSLKRWVRVYDREEGGAERNLALLHGACVMAPHEAAVRELLTEVEHQHRQALERRAALDFTGLLVQARDLLRDFPQARGDAQARFGALLVDEFQDTNRLQLELVLLLSEQRTGAPRPISTAFEAQHLEIVNLPLQPAFTAVVGDRKQAIYEFRGADVSVFTTMARCLEREGGGRAFLRHSRRSSPRLVAALNTTMARVLAAENYSSPLRDFEVVYEPASDDLVPVRTRQLDALPYVRLVEPPTEGEAVGHPREASAQREADADGVARYLAAVLRNPESLLVPKRDDAPLRRLRGGDVAMLFQRFTQLDAYRQALVRHGVRHRVVRGRGFFGAQEVVDLACVFALLSDPDDALAFAAVLRSPIVCLPDSALVELALPRGDFAAGLHPRDVLEQGRRPTAADPVSLTRLERFVTLWRTLRAERDRLGLRALVRAVVEGTALRVAVAAAPFGEQALANLDKLLELATARERTGSSVAAFSRELLELADTEPTEAQGAVVDELDLDAVTLCTVHQAKGLEWPMVVLADLTAPPRNESATVRFDRLAGLGVKPAATDEGELQSLSVERIADLHQARATAERLRLLYVAMTRARDRVVLGLFGEKPRAGSWAHDLRCLRDWGDLRAMTEEVDVSALPPGAPHADAVLEPALARRAVADVVARVRQAPPARAQQAMLAVTQLQDFVSCPRRFWLAHQVGLRDGPVHHGGEPLHLDPDVRERGTAAHRLIELTPLEAVSTLLPSPSAPSRGALEAALAAIREGEALEAATPEVLEWVVRFWRSRFGASLPALGEARVHRELPFVLTLRDPAADFTLLLRGQIDLLVEPAEGPVLVIDHKTALAPSGGLEAYRFQLGCYALAARRFTRSDVPVRTGIVFLRELDVEPRYLDTLPSGAELEQQLAGQARALTAAQVSGEWESRPRARCEALRCGFIYRCHPS
jgi:ATP-dependent helicase/nuclease subunit A